MQIEISRRGLRLVPSSGRTRAAQFLRLIRLSAVTFASFIVAQTVVLGGLALLP